MLHKILLGLSLLMVSTGVWAQGVEVRPDHPDTYVVEQGDTLWDISAMFLTEPWRWPEIWHVNPQIENPHLIFPGDRISLVYRDGEPVLTVDRDRRTVKLSPRVRYIEEEQAIHSIPIDAIREFLTRPLIFTDEQMSGLPYIVSSHEQHLVNASGNEIYVRGLPSDTSQRRYSVYRKGPVYRSPTKGELGYEAMYVGETYVHEFGDPATAVITESGREIYEGDRLIEESETDVNTDFIPREPSQPVTGSIISATDVLSGIGQYQVVALDLGQNDGLEVGHVLAVYQPGPVVEDEFANTEGYPELGPQEPRAESSSGGTRTDATFAKPGGADYPVVIGNRDGVRLPDKYTGVVLVFRVFDEVSYALVMEAEAPMHMYDVVKNP